VRNAGPTQVVIGPPPPPVVRRRAHPSCRRAGGSKERRAHLGCGRASRSEERLHSQVDLVPIALPPEAASIEQAPIVVSVGELCSPLDLDDEPLSP
jgi:hypothetical protein